MTNAPRHEYRDQRKLGAAGRRRFRCGDTDRRGRRPESAPKAQPRRGHHCADRADSGGRSHADGRQDRRSCCGLAPLGVPLLRGPERPRSDGHRNRVPQGVATLRDPETSERDHSMSASIPWSPRPFGRSSARICSDSSLDPGRSISRRSIAVSRRSTNCAWIRSAATSRPNSTRWTRLGPRRSRWPSPRPPASTASTYNTEWSVDPPTRSPRCGRSRSRPSSADVEVPVDATGPLSWASLADVVQR